MQLVEARLTWGDDVLGIAHLAPRKGLRIADFGLPFPEDAELDVPSIRRHSGPCWFVADALILQVALVDGAARIPAARSDWRVAKGVALGLLIHATFLAMAYFGRASDAELDSAQLDAMKAYMATLEERRIAVNVETLGQDDGLGLDAPNADSPGAAVKDGEAGASGNPARQNTRGMAQRSHGEYAREKDPRPRPEVETFGMIALLSQNGPGKSTGNAAFGSLEGPSAMGNMFGTTIEDAIGTGATALSGLGQGGGGLGGGIELSGVGDGCGPGCVGDGIGLGTVQGFGRGIGRLGGSHQTRSPTLRCGVVLDVEGKEHETCATEVNGRLPPEAVQRVVRANFGRLRGCYESGLRRNPTLEGRIAVKFVIDRSGAVAMASASDRDLPDQEVAQCVARGFQSMSFPQPEGGIVTVVYPIVFSTSP